MKLNNWQKALAATLFSQFIWGVAGPLVKIALDQIPPMSFLFLRSLVACLILFPIYEFVILPKSQRVRDDGEITTWANRKDMFWAGFLAVFANIALYFWGQQKTTVTDAWLIASTGTLFIVIISRYFFHERLTKKVHLGIILAFVGAIVIIGTPLLTAGSGSLFGNLLMVGATIAASLGYFPIKKLIDKYHPLTLVFYQFLLTMVLSLPFFLWDFFRNPLFLAQIPITVAAIIFYEAVGPSIVAYGLSNWGLKFLSPSLSSATGYLATFIAILLGIIFLGEKLTAFFFVGAVLIFVGLVLAESRHSRRFS